MSKIAKLTESEIDANPTVVPEEEKGASTYVSSLPADAPPMPTRHPQHGEPIARWLYHDAEGRVASAVCHFEPEGERKQVLPLTLWRDAMGYHWRWKGAPAPRPLYALDAITKNLDASIVVVEGEKSADGSAQIFDESIATTSPAGSQAAGKADWTPLAGRRVLIWPDADESGMKYARDVAETLAALGCEVLMIDAMALAAMAPDGSKREPVAGWDAADAVAEWSDLTALRKAAKALAKPFEPPPAYILGAVQDGRGRPLHQRDEGPGR